MAKMGLTGIDNELQLDWICLSLNLLKRSAGKSRNCFNEEPFAFGTVQVPDKKLARFDSLTDRTKMI